jgi:DNA-directed RNA polymerase specialized sigma24 family protein
LATPTFESLIDLHQREIMAYLLRNLRDAEAAQDAFQDTFLRAFRAYPRLPQTANRRAWLQDRDQRLPRCPAQASREPVPLDDTSFYRDDRRRRPRTALAVVIRRFLPRQQREAALLRKFQGAS